MAETDDDSWESWAQAEETQEAMKAAVAAMQYRLLALQPDLPDEVRDQGLKNFAGDAPAIPTAEAMFEEINSPRPSTNRRIMLAQLAETFFSVDRSVDFAADIGSILIAPWRFQGHYPCCSDHVSAGQCVCRVGG